MHPCTLPHTPHVVHSSPITSETPTERGCAPNREWSGGRCAEMCWHQVEGVAVHLQTDRCVEGDILLIPLHAL